MLLATINSGTLIIALPDLERELHTTLLQLVWVILVYMIVSTVLEQLIMALAVRKVCSSLKPLIFPMIQKPLSFIQGIGLEPQPMASAT